MNESLLNRILKDHKRRTRSLAMILCLSMIVSLGTFAGFHQTAIAKVYTREVLDCPYAREGAEPVAHVHNDDCYEGETLVCTLPEREAHTHDDTCYAESRLLSCGLEENPGHQHSEACFDENGELTCQIPEGEGAHVHTDDCYTIERALVCNQAELPVHVHDAGCFRTEEITVDEPEDVTASEQAVSTVPEMPVSDPNADVETAEDWNREFENFELSGNWARDLVLVAATQQGRGESPNNFEAVLNDAGDAWVTHGYTRYGAWYGYPYAEWDAMFVSFCLRYAGIPVENVPNNPTAAFMADSFSMGELFAGRDYVPAVGDLIFFDTVDDEITNIDHMGIVYHVDTENGTINVVEGDRTDVVAAFGYYLNDEQIVGYGILPQNPNYVPNEDENTDVTDEAFDGFIFMTTDEDEETEETPTTEEAPAPAVSMPAQSWERTAGGIKVTVDAPEGAFPENTRIAVTPVNGNSLKDTVSDAVEGEVLEVQAVDITFFDAEGREIEPAVPIRVVMTPAATEHAEEKASVVHVDIAQQTAELIEQAEGTETDNSEVVFDAEAFTIYAIVYTVDFEYEVNGKLFTSSMPSAEDMPLSEIVKGLGIVGEEELETFLSKIASVTSTNEEVAVVTEDRSVRVLKDGDAQIVITMQDGAAFSITVEAEGVTEISDENEVATVSTVNDLYLPAAGEVKAELLTEEKSENAIAAVQTATESEENTTATESASYQAFSIALENVDVTAYNGFNVAVTLPEDAVVGRDFQLYQVKEDGTATDLTESLTVTGEPNEDGLQNVSGISFTTEDFADFVLSYSIETYYTTAGGDTYRITLNYGPKAGIPEGAELNVKEILPEDESYTNYLNESAAKLGVNSGDVSFARFFDIEIRKDDEKIEPKAPVQVTISLTDAPEETVPEDLKVLHFAETGLETIDGTQAEQKENATIDLSFETNGFSVYGVITVPAPTGASDLNGRAFTICRDGRYLTTETGDIGNGGDGAIGFRKGNKAGAPVWQFEQVNGSAYYISTMVGGQKKYMHLEKNNSATNRANATLSDAPQEFNVEQENGVYRLSTYSNGTRYYLDEHNGTDGNGFAGWHDKTDNGKLIFDFTPPVTELGKQYAIIVKYNNQYYSVFNDGKLLPADSTYDPVTNTVGVDMEYPLLWTYQSVHVNADPDNPSSWGNGPYNFLVPTVAKHFAENNVADQFYYRYINPREDKGWSEESSTYQDLAWWSSVHYEDHRIHGDGDYAGKYIGVSETGGLHIIGNTVESDAAEIYLAAISVSAPNSETHDTHMVNHIDIAIEGGSTIKIPLAYGVYYDKNGSVIYTATKADHILEMTPTMDLTVEDMKTADISASAIVDGKREELDNVFYITGYSQNHETGANLAQVRIEGSFKVSNIPDAVNADNDPEVRAARKGNPIDYSVSVVKTVPVNVLYNGQQLYSDQNGTSPLVFNVPISLTASFNYWDEGNKCPPLHLLFNENADFVQDWKDGKIVGNGWDMSGMDFELGTAAQGNIGAPAIEINKAVMREDGSYLVTNETHDVAVKVFYKEKASGEENNLVDVAVNESVDASTLSNLTSGYTQLHSKTVTIGTDGVGATYDYDVDRGLLYIQEDESSVDKYVTGRDGKTYQYVCTRMETEYAWRTDGDEGKVHNADGTTSVPEVLGRYEYEGNTGLDNGFLEFYIYNVYKEVETVDVPVDKTWHSSDDSSVQLDNSYTWTSTFVLEEMEVHESGPVSSEANTTVWRAVDGVSPITISNGDSESARTFAGLPKYRFYDVDGVQSVYRIMYSVDETAYELKQDGTTISKWDKNNGLTVGDVQYTPHWPHDAGDANDESGIGPEDENFYHVIVENHKKDETVINTLTDLKLQKQWPEGALAAAGVQETDAYATFQLKRYVTREHISYDPDYYDGSDATVTLIGQDGNTDTLTVKKGARVNVEATFNGTGEFRYYVDGDGTSCTVTRSWDGDTTTKTSSTSLTVTDDITIKSSKNWGNGLITEDHLVLAAGAGSETAEDTEYSAENHTYTLNRGNGWTQVLDNLPLYSESAVVNGEQNTYRYSYYFTEVDSNPSGFYAEFTDGSGNPIGDASHRVTADNTTVTATNKKIPDFYVQKEWHDIEDPDNYPEIRFTLYQGLIGNDGKVQQGSVFVGTNGESYVDIPLNSDNNWTWKCPGFLPTTNEAGQNVGYYAVESTNSGSNGRAVNLYYNSELNPDGSIRNPGELISATTPDRDQIWLWDYYNDKNDYNAYRDDQQMPRGWDGGIGGNEGTLTIVNRAPKYMQMDIKKKIMEYQSDGSLATTTGWESRTKDIVLKIQLMRRVYLADATVNDEPLVNWTNYGVPFYVGYDSNGHDVAKNDNDFDVGEGLSSWHWTILNNKQENGLPAYGYYTKPDGTIVKVHYRYIPFEIGAYSNLNEDPINPEFDWFIGLQPNAWDGAYGEVSTFTPMIGQDGDRLMNIQASDLEVDKDWTNTPDNVEEVYVKIYRSINDTNVVEDFTHDIATRTDVLDVYGFVDDPSRLQTLDNGVLVLGLTPETGGVLIHRVLMTPETDNANLNTHYYEYWIEEVGYKDKDGNVYLNSSASSATSTFFPEYGKSDGQGQWIESWTTDPTDNKLKLTTKGNNKLRVKNQPTKDIEVEKKWYDSDGTLLPDGPWTEGPENKPVATSIAFKVKRSDGVYLTFNGQQILSIKENGQRAVVRTTESGSAAYTVTYVSDDVDLADIGSWKTIVHGLEKYASDGTEYTYSIEEARDDHGDLLDGEGHKIPGLHCETTVDGFVIKNQKAETSLVIQKIFTGSAADELINTQKETVYFEVHGNEAHGPNSEVHKKYMYSCANGSATGEYIGQETQEPKASKDIVASWNNGVLTLKKIPAGTYTVTEYHHSVEDLFGTGTNIVHTWTYKVGETTTEGQDPDTGVSATVKPDEITRVIITNTYDELANGALKISKIVRVNGTAPTQTQYSEVDGTYVFSVVGPTSSEKQDQVTKYVQITVSDGVMASYKVADSNTPEAWSAAQEVPESSGALVSDLPEGDYVVTELPEEGMYVSSITGGKMTGESGSDNDANTEARTVTVHVTAGDTMAEQAGASVSYTNDKTFVDIKIIKIDDTTREAASQTKLPSAEFQLFKYTVSGTSSSYTVYPNLDESKQTTSSIEGDSFGTLTFGNLPDGQYKISETVPPAGYLKVENNDIYFDIVSGAITRYDKGVNEADRAVIEEDRNTANITYSKIDKSFTVGNIPGAALPQTGGIGTTLFTALGGLMTATAGAILTIRRKRKPAEA